MSNIYYSFIWSFGSFRCRSGSETQEQNTYLRFYIAQNSSRVQPNVTAFINQSGSALVINGNYQ